MQVGTCDRVGGNFAFIGLRFRLREVFDVDFVAKLWALTIESQAFHARRCSGQLAHHLMDFCLILKSHLA